MNFAQTVLLPVDMQKAFDGPSWPRHWNGSVDRNGQAILGALRGVAGIQGSAGFDPIATIASECNNIYTATDCFPSGAALVSLSSSSIENGGLWQYTSMQPYFSPASICPSGWTTVLAILDSSS